MRILENEIREHPSVYDQSSILIAINKILKERSEPFSQIESYQRRTKTILENLQLKPISKYNLEDSAEIYRLSLDRFQQREKLIITIINKSKAATLEIYGFQLKDKKIRSKDGNITNAELCDTCVDIIRNKNIFLKQKQWKQFIKIINDVNFWELKSMDNRIGLDGSDWIFEGAKKDTNKENLTYQKIIRWHPKEESSIRKIGDFLLQLSQEDFGKLY